jgi:hypothetical protein
MSSAIISLQTGHSCTKSYGIDKTMPAIMNGKVPQSDWTAFCEQVENELQPLSNMQLSFQTLFGFFLVGCIVVAISMIVSFSLESASGVIFVLFLVPFAFAISLFVFSICMASKVGTVFDNIQKICAETSKKSRIVSYHLRNDVIVGGYDMNTNTRHTYRNVYIEVSISDQHFNNNYASNYASNYPSNDVATATAAAIPVTTLGYYSPPASNSSYSLYVSSAVEMGTPEHRLNELEKIKHLLTPKEYETKRAEILSAV